MVCHVAIIKVMKPTAYIFDVDGTLANVDPYLHHVRGDNKDYDAFHESSIGALPNIEVLEMLNNAVSDGHSILVVTSRKEKWRGLTSMWLAKTDARSHALFMRADDDHRQDYEVKKDILDKIVMHWDVVHAVDDNPNVIRLWEENGITTTKIGTWDGNRS
jgi:phosphoglycolate phosphatase-like HAD superfamily hydrolase